MPRRVINGPDGKEYNRDGMPVSQVPGVPGATMQPGRPMQPAPMIPNKGRDMSAEPAVTQASAVRTGAAEDAYNMGVRMGSEALVNEQLPDRDFRKNEPDRGITKEKLRDAERTLMKYKAGKASVDRRIIHAQQWWKMRNWQEIEQNKGVRGATEHKSATGWLWNCIVGKHADAIDSYPEPVILPRMQDDKEEAQKLSDIVPVVMEMNGFEETFSLCQWQKMQEGTAGYAVMWDKSKLNGMGDISIRRVNLLNLFWEPGITDIQDSKNVFFVRLMDNDQLEQMYPELKGQLKNNALVVAKYVYDDNVNTEEKSAVVDWYYHRWDGGKKVLHYCQFVGEHVLYSTENEGMQNGLYDDGLYPFVLDPLFPIEGSPAGYGYIDIGKDAQSDIDVLNQAMVQNAACSATPRYFVRKDGAVNEDEFADWSKPMVHVNGMLGDDSLKPVQVNTLNGNVISMLQQKIEELKFVSGNTDVNNGGVPSGVTAASAIAALKEDAGRSSKDSTRASYRAYSKIVTMVIERIRQFYDIPRQFRILGERGEEQFTSYSNAGIVPQPMQGGLGLDQGYRLPAFDIDVRCQRENAYTKMSQNELALQFYQLGFFNPQMTDQSLMTLEMMDFKGKEEISQKIQQTGTMMQTLQQIGQIAMALAQKFQPEIADQLAMTLQGAAGGMMALPSGQADSDKLGAATKANDATQRANEPNESTITRKAAERAANATRVD